jgi:hypothetical protein
MRIISVAFVGLFIFISSHAFGQISLRPFVGVNSSTLTKDFNNVAWQSEAGYQVGADLLIGNRVYFAPGVHWELIRQNFDPTNPIPGFDTQFRSSHIRVPLLLGFRAFSRENGGFFNLRLFTGPDVAFRTSSSEHAFLGIELNNNTYKNLSWSWNGGIGVDVLFLFIDVGYKIGLSDYFENSINNGSRTNIFYANAGFRFGL